MIRIRCMTAADLPLGLALSRQAGWNQTETDWQRLLGLQPDGVFVAEWNGQAAGTTLTTIFGPVAWVAMVLVELSMRGRGIGLALMTHALDFLDRQGVRSIRLDATELGQPLYERLGFVEQFRLARFAGTLPPIAPVTGIRSAQPDQWDALTATDKAVTKTDRRRLLLRLFADQPDQVRYVENDGYLTSRPGALAVHLGPCCASEEAGERLLRDAWQRHAGQRVFLDVPTTHRAATRQALEMGMTVQRQFARMVRGLPVQENVQQLWASAGPEKG